jgi:hypothetical protein
MINELETEVGIIANTKKNKLGNINIFNNSNSCSSCSLIAFTT